MQVWATRWTFVVLGAIYGSWAVRIPDVARHAHVSNGQLGLVLFALAAGSLVGMPLAGLALNRWALPKLIRAAVGVFALAGVLLTAAPSLMLLLLVAFIFGAVNGAYGILINSAATALEAGGRRVVASCHASFSVATLTASLIGGMAVSHLVPWCHLTIVGALCFIGSCVACPRLPQGELKKEGARNSLFPRHRVVWLASGMAFIALFAEGVVTDWSAFFLQHALIGHASAQQTWGYAGFSAAMASGRACGDAVLERFSERVVLWGSLSMAVVGYLMVSLAPILAVALAGFALIGLGLSNLYPAMISLSAAQLPADERHAAIAAVSGIGYFGFLIGPAVLGFAVQVIGLRPAIATPVLALGCGAILLVGLLRAGGPRG